MENIAHRHKWQPGPLLDGILHIDVPPAILLVCEYGCILRVTIPTPKEQVTEVSQYKESASLRFRESE
jgi:hypothetical protein